MTSPPSPAPRSIRPLLLRAGLAVSAVVVLCLVFFGRAIQMSPQGIHLFQSARALRDHGALEILPGQPLAVFPPLQAVLLAGLAALGLSPISALVLLNAIAYVGGIWIFRELAGRAGLRLPGAATLLYAVLAAHAYFFLMARPDAIVPVLAMATMLALHAHATSGRRTLLIGAGLAAAASTLARYMGLVTVVPMAVAAILRAPGRDRSRGRDLAQFLPIALVPVGAWMLRTWFLTGHATGMSRAASGDESVLATLGGNVVALVRTIAVDLFGVRAMGVRAIVHESAPLPHATLTALALGIGAILLATALAAAIRGARHSPARTALVDPAATHVRRMMATYTAIHAGALLVLWTFSNNDPVHTRFVAPLYGGLIFLLFAARDALAARAGSRFGAAAIAGLAIVIGVVNVDKAGKLLGEMPSEALLKTQLYEPGDLWVRDLAWSRAHLLAVDRGPRAAPGPRPRRAGREAPRHLVLIVVDTLRQDSHGAYGEPRRLTPHLDALAARGAPFENAYTVSPWTLPSTASIVTGLYPSRHGATLYRKRLPDEAPTLAEILREEGFRTAGVVSNVLLKTEYGFDRGFDRYDEAQAQGHSNVSAVPVTDTAEELLRAMVEEEGRLCLFVHYFDPHYAYQRHPMFGYSADGAGRLHPDDSLRTIRAMLSDLTEEELGFLRDRYDEEVAWTDQGVGRLLRRLDDLGLAGETLVVFTSDHGEEFYTHGWIGHTNSLFDDVMRVPLIVRDPRFDPRVERRATSVVGVTPTILELLGVKTDIAFQGESFASGVSGLGAAWDDELFLEVDFHPAPGGTEEKRATLQALLSGGRKLVRDTSTGELLLFDLVEDPGEQRDLADTDREVARAMAQVLTERAAEAASDPLKPRWIEVSPEQRERLRALGYLGGN